MFAYPDIIKLVHGFFYNLRAICHDARFEVTLVIALHPYPCSCEVGTTDVHLLAVKDQYLEMHTRTEHSLQAVIQNRISVKILAKVWAWFFGMNKSYLHSTPDELGNESQKRFLFFAHFHVKVFNISSTNPKRASHGLYP